MKNILITGGAGFIGSHVARALLARGEAVTMLDDFNDRYDPRLKEARVKYMYADTAAPKLMRGDICDRDFLGKVFSEGKFDQVIHLAAWASVQPSIDNPYIYTQVNVDGTVNVLEEARKHGIKNMVFASSSSVYGGIKDVPFREDMIVNRPVSPYAATKAAGEIMCATWHHLYGMPITALRFFTVYGPWGRPEMAIFKFTEAILKGEEIAMRGKTTQRDFTYIDDIVQGVLGALENQRGFEVYNLGESDGVPLPRLIAALEAATGKQAQVKEVPLPKGDLPATLADISKARAEIGYAPKTSIEEGVGRFVAWYREEYFKLKV